MLLPFAQCSFDKSLDNNAIKKLRNVSSREKEKCCSGFGGWLTPARKRKTKPRTEETKARTDKQHMKLLKTDSLYYKRYRVDPLEGTFKHYNNSSQYIKSYRETTTLCYKQKTLTELSSMYNCALDNHHGLEKGAISGRYNLDTEACTRTWGTGSETPTQADVALFMKEHHLNIPPIQEQFTDPNSLMLLPTPPSIPRLQQAAYSPSQISQSAFMCNAYLNRNTVCPVHRRNIIVNSRPNVTHPTMEHMKVELPGIPKRRLRRDMDVGRASATKGFSTAPSALNSTILDEDEDPNTRIDQLLGSSIPTSPSEKISKALSQKRTAVPSMLLPITALLQYSHGQQEHHKGAKAKKKPLKTKDNLRKKNLRIPSNATVNKPEIKQVVSIPPDRYVQNNSTVSYEKQYERYFSDILESKGRATQKKHHQSLSNSNVKQN